MEDILSAFVSKTLNIDESKFSELVKTDEGEFKKDALALLLEKDQERVQGFKTADDDVLKKRFDNGFAKGKQESLGNFEKDVRTKFEFDNPDLKGIDLINAIVDTKVSSLNKGGGKVTDDIVKAHPAYLGLHERLTKEKSEVVKEWETKYNGLETTVAQAKTMGVINTKANAIIDKLKPVFSADPLKATNQKKMILSQLASNKYDIQEDRIVVMDSTGTPLEDDHRNPVQFEALVQDITTGLFDLHQSKPRSSAGKGDGSNEAGGSYENSDSWSWNKVKPKSDAEYMELIKNASSLEEKTAITESFKS